MPRLTFVSDFKRRLPGDKTARRSQVAAAVERFWGAGPADLPRPFSSAGRRRKRINLRTCAVFVRIEETPIVVLAHVVEVKDEMQVTWEGAAEALSEKGRATARTKVRNAIEAASGPSVQGAITVEGRKVVFTAYVVPEPLSCTVSITVGAIDRR